MTVLAVRLAVLFRVRAAREQIGAERAREVFGVPLLAERGHGGTGDRLTASPARRTSLHVVVHVAIGHALELVESATAE